MKAEELMIGDWVAFRGHPYRYTANDIQEMYECEVAGVPTDTSAIPLTSEILEKNGIKYQFGMPWYQGGYDGLGYEVHFDQHCQIPITYVHELQHALKLFGIQKEINL